MMSKRPIFFDATGGPMQADGHLPDSLLLLAIDGELSSAERALVKKHVRACWSCRARREHLERTIAEIVEYEHRLVAPDMPPSAGGRAIFMARLDQVAADLGRPVPHWRLLAFVAQMGRVVLSSRLAHIAAAVLVVTTGAYLMQQRNIPVVSASELLQRALASQSRSLAGVSQPVVVQKLSIEINGHKIARTIYRDAVRKRMVQRSNVSASEELEVAHDFGRSSFSWDDPLSPQAYSQWREGVSRKQESVKQVNAAEIRLNTVAGAGPVTQASLTFRATDYHPVAEELRLSDNTLIEVAEISYEVVGLSSLGADVFGITAPHVETPHLSLHTAPIPSPEQLEAAELQVYSALHTAAADMGEQITVRRSGDGQIEVNGITENDARKQQVVSALNGIPYATAKIETVAEATAHIGANIPHASHATLVTSNPPLLEAQLKRGFPDAGQRTEFVTASLSFCQDASAHAWALNRLADRYMPQDVELLSPDDRSRLQAMLTDHIAAIREDMSHLQGHLSKVLDAEADAASTAELAAAPPPEDWRINAHRAHESVEVANDAVSSLLIGATGAEESPQKLQRRLHVALIRLQKEVETLEKRKYP
jgi:anti-sigma factor RsiW